MSHTRYWLIAFFFLLSNRNVDHFPDGMEEDLTSRARVKRTAQSTVFGLKEPIRNGSRSRKKPIEWITRRVTLWLKGRRKRRVEVFLLVTSSCGSEWPFWCRDWLSASSVSERRAFAQITWDCSVQRCAPQASAQLSSESSFVAAAADPDLRKRNQSLVSGIC